MNIASTRRTILIIAIFAALSGLVFGFKGDEQSAGRGQLKIYLINTSPRPDSVVIIVKAISVRSESHEWIMVNDKSQTIDLLKLTNDQRSMLGETSLEPGRYTQMRFLLDEGSYVVVSGIRHPITMPNEFATGIRLLNPVPIGGDLWYELYLNFDANGNVCTCKCCRKFKPVMHAYLSQQSARNNAVRTSKASTESGRCRCGDRWDHRRQNRQHCRHCASLNSNGAIG